MKFKFMSCFIFMCLVSCSSATDFTYERFVQEMNMYEDQYYNSDISIAENAMLDLEEMTKLYVQHDVKGILYDDVLWRTYGRLYLISFSRNNATLSEKYLHLTMEHLKKFYQRKNLSKLNVDVNKEYTVKIVNVMDSQGGRVIWKEQND